VVGVTFTDNFTENFWPFFCHIFFFAGAHVYTRRCAMALKSEEALEVQVQVYDPMTMPAKPIGGVTAAKCVCGCGHHPHPLSPMINLSLSLP
jgi:hypothetical protein